MAGKQTLTQGLLRRRAANDAATATQPAAGDVERPARPMGEAFFYCDQAADPLTTALESGGGQALGGEVAARLEHGFGTSLGHVRLHRSEASAHAADAIGARAFALGPDIHFGAGEYDPATPAGLHLLAHEVAHTLQAPSGDVRPQTIEIGAANSPDEASADAAADRVLAGGRDAATLLSPGSGNLGRVRRNLRVPLPGIGSAVVIDNSRAELTRAVAINWDHGQNISESNWWGTLTPGSEPERPVNVRAGHGGVIRVDLVGNFLQDNLMTPEAGRFNHILHWDYTTTPQGAYTTLTPRAAEVHDGRNTVVFTTASQEDAANGIIRISLNFAASGTSATTSASGGVGVAEGGVTSGAHNLSGGHTYNIRLRTNWMGRQEPTPTPTPTPAPTRAAPEVPESLQHFAYFATRSTRLSDPGVRDLQHWLGEVSAVPELGEAIRQGLVPIHIIGSASQAGGDRDNFDYAEGRVAELQRLLTGRMLDTGHRSGGMLGAPGARFVTMPLGEFHATPPRDNPIDRYALVTVNAAEARAGILRLRETQDHATPPAP